MHDFLATLRRPSATLIVSSTLVITVLSGAVAISNLIGRVEKLESDIKSLRADLDHPRPEPLASILDAPR